MADARFKQDDGQTGRAGQCVPPFLKVVANDPKRIRKVLSTRELSKEAHETEVLKTCLGAARIAKAQGKNNSII